MALYFFDTDDGTHVFRDEIGLELDDDQAARDEGARALAELAREYIPGGEPQKNITMWVRNADGTPLLQLSISFAVKPLV
ncbi:MAG TPA: hypothetical protein VFE52_02610 [Devosia sp.]|jgi:hypothetical protein|nr:hypothetical protein [Devosia sp.]